jgi:alanine racemase
MNLMQRTYSWAEINLGNLRYNIRQLRTKCGPDRGIIAVVKSDAYGHGMVPVAKELARLKVDFLAVAIIDEAEKLKQAGIQRPVIILSRSLPADIPRVIKGGFIQVVGSVAEARLISQAAVRARKRVAIHIKVDTGMNRLGIPSKHAPGEIQKIGQLPNIIPEGVMTHFIDSGNLSQKTAAGQINKFNNIINNLKLKGIHFKYSHCANSGGVINIPGAYYNMLRPGLSVYGYYPSPANLCRIRLKSLLTLKSRVINIRVVEKGETVSYGGTWTAPRSTRVAVISIGYGDGYPRQFSNKGFVLIKGKRVPVIGIVCMNHTLVNIDRVKNVRIGDEAVLYGRQGKQEIKVEEAARSIGTIPYELTCRIKMSVPRYYRKA